MIVDFRVISYNLIMQLVRSPFNLQEKLETPLRLLWDFIRTMAVELPRYSCGWRTNVYERQQFLELQFCTAFVQTP